MVVLELFYVLSIDGKEQDVAVKVVECSRARPEDIDREASKQNAMCDFLLILFLFRLYRFTSFLAFLTKVLCTTYTVSAQVHRFLFTWNFVRVRSEMKSLNSRMLDKDIIRGTYGECSMTFPVL